MTLEEYIKEHEEKLEKLEQQVRAMGSHPDLLVVRFRDLQGTYVQGLKHARDIMKGEN